MSGYPSHFQRTALLVIALLAILISIPLILAWQAVRKQQINHDLVKAVDHNGTMNAIQLLNAGADANITDGKAKVLSVSQTLTRTVDGRTGHRAIRTISGNPLLIVATANGNGPLVKALLDHGTNVNAVCNRRYRSALGMDPGNSALLIAAFQDQTGIVRLLLSRRATVNTKNAEGSTALILAVQGMMYRALNSSWARSTEQSNNGSIAQRQSESVACIDLLLDHRANINERDNEGLTALMWALKTSMLTPKVSAMYVRELLHRGADANLVDRNRGTALMWAARNGDVDSLRALIQVGAKLNLRDQNGETALGIMQGIIKMEAGKENYECARLLKAAGAKI